MVFLKSYAVISMVPFILAQDSHFSLRSDGQDRRLKKGERCTDEGTFSISEVWDLDEPEKTKDDCAKKADKNNQYWIFVTSGDKPGCYLSIYRPTKAQQNGHKGEAWCNRPERRCRKEMTAATYWIDELWKKQPKNTSKESCQKTAKENILNWIFVTSGDKQGCYLSEFKPVADPKNGSEGMAGCEVKVTETNILRLEEQAPMMCQVRTGYWAMDEKNWIHHRIWTWSVSSRKKECREAAKLLDLNWMFVKKGKNRLFSKYRCYLSATKPIEQTESNKNNFNFLKGDSSCFKREQVCTRDQITESPTKTEGICHYEACVSKQLNTDMKCNDNQRCEYGKCHSIGTDKTWQKKYSR